MQPNHVGPVSFVESAAARLVSRNSQTAPDSFSPLKGTFTEKRRREAAGHDPFESLIDPHAPVWMKKISRKAGFSILPDLNTKLTVAQYLPQNSRWQKLRLDGYRVTHFLMWVESSGRSGTRDCGSCIHISRRSARCFIRTRA